MSAAPQFDWPLANDAEALLRRYIASFLDRLTRDEVQRYYERYIGPCYTSDGRVDLNVAQRAVDAVATELGVAAASVDQMYQPAL